MVTMSDNAAQPLETATPIISVNPNNQQMKSNDSVTSDYEKCREQRIKENFERMQKLGIYDLSLKLKSVKPNSYRKNNKHLSTNHNKTPNRCISPLPSSVPTRRSSRLQNTPTVSYTEVVLSKKGKDGNDMLISDNSRPEVYTEGHEKLLGDAKTEWTLFVDGYGKDGKKIYDQVRGKTCHQCRQKTLGHRTHCVKCNLVQGQFCGDCLYMRYGENVLEAMQNPEWICPVCRGICNCSLCRQAKGWAPTGVMYRKISSLGYKSVAHYLIQTRRSDPNSETSICAKRSLPFSSEEVEESKECDIAKNENINESEQEGIIATNEAIKDEKPIELQSSNKPSLCNNVKLEIDQELKDKNPEAEIVDVVNKTDDEVYTSVIVNKTDSDYKVNKTDDEVNRSVVNKTDSEYKVNKTDDEVNTSVGTPVTKGSRKRREPALENGIAGRLRSRRKCT